MHDDVRRRDHRRLVGRSVTRSGVVAGWREAGGQNEVERPLHLVHVVVDPVAHVEQRAGVVD